MCDELNENNVIDGKETLDKNRNTLARYSTKILKRWYIYEISCAKSCTCESIDELDMVYDCDHDESEFNYMY